ncbi:MAG: magnesium and cobalt transport protein CorA [Casimicrobiaceae bacterium]|nr:magnesium and cobalt transport protein CorA [Casimicrobiaceae bacterium]MDW8311341.1 magnesium and cobalt transport protein CorA [Burkholderiales bacterium]
MLLHCAAYVNGVCQPALEVAAVSDFLANNPPPGSFVWIALSKPDAALLATMQEELELHELAIEDMNRGGQRPKLEHYGKTLFLSVSTARKRGEELASGELHCYLGERFLLTVLHDAPLDVAALRAQLEREPEFLALGPGAVLHTLLDAWVDGLFPELDRLESSLEAIEERIFDKRVDNRSTIEELYELKRETTQLRRVVTPLIEVCQGLLELRHEVMAEPLRPYFRDVLDHTLRIQAAIDTLRDLQNAATQTNLALVTLAEGETTKKLAAWGAVLTVPMITGTIYGMNFEHMPELKWPYGYPLALLAMLATSVGVWGWFKRIRWI